jgi:hypothetical protein
VPVPDTFFLLTPFFFMALSSDEQRRALEKAAASGSASAIETLTVTLDKSNFRLVKRAAEIAVQLNCEQLLPALKPRHCRLPSAIWTTKNWTIGWRPALRWAHREYLVHWSPCGEDFASPNIVRNSFSNWA